MLYIFNADIVISIDDFHSFSLHACRVDDEKCFRLGCESKIDCQCLQSRCNLVLQLWWENFDDMTLSMDSHGTAYLKSSEWNGIASCFITVRMFWLLYCRIFASKHTSTNILAISVQMLVPNLMKVKENFSSG